MVKKSTTLLAKKARAAAAETKKPAAALLIRPFTPAQVAARARLMVKLSASGLTDDAIGRFFEPRLSRQRVFQVLQQERFKRPPKPHVARRKAIPGLIRQGMNGKEIAAHLGVHWDLIYPDVRAIGLSDTLKKKLAENRARAMSEIKKQAYQDLLAAVRKSERKAAPKKRKA